MKKKFVFILFLILSQFYFGQSKSGALDDLKKTFKVFTEQDSQENLEFLVKSYLKCYDYGIQIEKQDLEEIKFFISNYANCKDCIGKKLSEDLNKINYNAQKLNTDYSVSSNAGSTTLRSKETSSSYNEDETLTKWLNSGFIKGNCLTVNCIEVNLRNRYPGINKDIFVYKPYKLKSRELLHSDLIRLHNDWKENSNKENYRLLVKKYLECYSKKVQIEELVIEEIKFDILNFLSKKMLSSDDEKNINSVQYNATVLRTDYSLRSKSTPR